jgi:hypothetical protein
MVFACGRNKRRRQSARKRVETAVDDLEQRRLSVVLTNGCVKQVGLYQFALTPSCSGLPALPYETYQ